MTLLAIGLPQPKSQDVSPDPTWSIFSAGQDDVVPEHRVDMAPLPSMASGLLLHWEG